MGANLAIFLTFVVFFVLLLSGLYIHSMLLAVGAIGIIFLGKTALLKGMLGYSAFITVATYSMTTIPLYVLTAQLVLQAGVVEDLFNLVYNISRGKRGVLGAVCMILGAFLGAVCGSGAATSAALGQAAYPQLVKRGFKSDLAAAVSASAGSLSGIIPPSVVIIVYGVTTETPIGSMFVGSVLPGILTTTVFILCTWFFLFRDGRKAKSEGNQSVEVFKPVKLNKRSTIISGGVGAAIAITIFGGIYSGFMTATEAGAVGAFVAFIAALLLGKVNKNFLIKAGNDTIKVTAMVMLIIIGAKLFGKFMSLSQMSRRFVVLLGPLMDHPQVVLAILIFVYFILFMLMEGTAVILMTTPVLLPVMQEMGVDLLWFGIIVCFCCVIGQLTPPVGMCVYSVCGVSKISVEGPFKLSLFYSLAATIIVGSTIVLFPSIVTWLPSMMG